MATFKCEIRRHQQRADGTYNVKIRITHRRASRWLPTSIYVGKDDITGKGRIKVQAVADRCEDLLRRVRESAAKVSPFALEQMSVDELTEWIRKDQSREGWRLDFFEWGQECMERMSAGARGNYRNALSALARFYGRREKDINDMRAVDIRAFGEWLENEPKQGGTGRKGEVQGSEKRKAIGGVSRSYVRSLARLHALARKRYNDPDAERQAIPRNPFDGYEAPKRSTAKVGQRPLPVEVIQAMIDDRESRWEQREALDVFLLSFALMGANLADLWDAVPPKKVVWVYRRKKVAERKGAGAEIRVDVPACIEPILENLRDRSGRRWLRLWMGSTNKDACTKKMNKRLKAWAEKQGLQPFTLYAARHSWGTIAHSAEVGADKAAVDEAMGHDGDLDMANIYIEKDWRLLNGINERVLGLFDWSKPR